MRRALAPLATLALLAAGAFPLLADATPLPQEASCAGVWVVVEETSRCAVDHPDGLTALRSAGFSAETGGGLVCRIEGIPATCVASFEAYWSYWHATRNPDGTLGPWTYSDRGANQYHPVRGDAEGWAFGDGSAPPIGRPPVGSDPIADDASPAPGAAPAVTPATTPAAAPTSAPSTPPGPTGPVTAALTLGLLTLGGAGLAWGVRRRRAP